VTIARDLELLDHAGGHVKNVYVVPNPVIQAVTSDVLRDPEASGRWPQLARIAALHANVERGEISKLLNNPAPEVVNRVVAVIKQAIHTDPVFKQALEHLLTKYLNSDSAEPVFRSSDLVPTNTDSSKSAALRAKRFIQRLGLTSHGTNPNPKSAEHLTKLGKCVFDNNDIANLLLGEPTTLLSAAAQKSGVNTVPVGGGVERQRPEPTPIHVSAQEVSWDEVGVKLQALVEDRAATVTPLQARGLTPADVMSRLDVMEASLGVESISLEEVLPLIGSGDFWRRVSTVHLASERDSRQDDVREPARSGFGKLEAEIATIAKRMSSGYPYLVDAEAVAKVIVEGFIFRNSFLLDTRKRPVDEVMRVFRQSDVSPLERARMEKALASLSSAQCVTLAGTSGSGRSASLNSHHPFVQQIVPKLLALRGGAAASK
jgi:hypothetical protein